jgi:hypothetical protein
MKRLPLAAVIAVSGLPTALLAPHANADPPVAESRVVTRPNHSLITSGVITLGASYGASAIVAAQSDHPGDKRLFIPVVGPWLDLTDRGSCPSNTSCDGETGYKVLIVVDGIVQAVGALDIVAGFLMPETVTTVAKSAPSTSVAVFQPKVHVAPVSMASGYGLAAVGTF